MCRAEKPVQTVDDGPRQPSQLHRNLTPFGTGTTNKTPRARTAAALLMAAAVLAANGCRKQTQEVHSPQPAGTGSMRQYDGTLEPDDGQWVRATKDYANTRY